MNVPRYFPQCLVSTAGAEFTHSQYYSLIWNTICSFKCSFVDSLHLIIQKAQDRSIACGDSSVIQTIQYYIFHRILMVGTSPNPPMWSDVREEHFHYKVDQLGNDLLPIMPNESYPASVFNPV